MQEFVSAVIEWGSYPFPSRTRKSSPTSPMVPGPRIRESRSPLDSRPPRGKPPGGLFFCAPFRLAATLSRPRLVNTSRLSLTGPLPRRLGASSFLRAAARANVLPGLRRGARSRHHGRSIPAALGSQPPRGKSSRGPFFFCTRAHPAVLRGVSLLYHSQIFHFTTLIKNPKKSM